MPVGRGERGGGSGTCGRLKVGGRTEDVEDVYALPWSRSCHTHHAPRAKECMCRLMHCGAFTTRQPDRSCAHEFKRANEHAKGHTCDKVWDGLCILWSRSCHQGSPTEAVRTYSKGPTSMQKGTRVTQCGMCSHDPARPVASSPKLNSHFVGQTGTGLL